MRFPGFIGPSYTLQSVNVDCQRCVNLYPEMNELGTGKEREVASLVPTPGLLLKLTLPQLPVRGLWRSSTGTLYAVGGNKFYSISSSWVATELGSLSTSTGPVSMADNGLHVFIVDGSFGYTLTISGSVFAQVTDPNFYASDTVTFQDGYFIFAKKNSKTFFWSDLYNITFNALSIGSVEGSPDYLLAALSANQNVYMFGTQSTEVFYNTGDASSTFARIQGAISGIGCSAIYSIAKLQGTPYWVGGDETGVGIIYRMNGYQPERVSTAAIEAIIRSVGATNLASARAWTYQQGGHNFYCLTLPGYDATIVYDASTNLWHERAYRDPWSLKRHRADCSAVAYGLNVVGDWENGNVYALDQSTYSDNGTPITRIRRTPHTSQDMKRIFHSSLQIDMEVGVGLSGTGQGTAPQAMIRWSDDGGHTWSSERWVSIGAIGETRARAIVRRLGSSRDRVYELTISDPVKVVLIGAELEVEGGAA